MKSILVLSLMLDAAGSGSMVVAQSSGTFTATGSMTAPRFLHTATLLADGRVLIAGGAMMEASGFKAQSSAESYDPRTGTFSATGNMITPRNRHTATLLPDGRVLITGGLPENGGRFSSLASAELYDPRTGTFSATGEMATARGSPTATLLNNGKVLFVSWCYTGTGFGCFPADAELYDSDTGTFAATGNRNFEGADTSTLLPNGKVLITRGYPPAEPYASWAKLYDPSTGAFTATGYAETNHSVPTATLMMNGKVMIAGGDIGDGDGGSFIAELYDPATGAFSRTGNMTLGREQHTETLLPDGSVLFAGGHLAFDLAASAEIYDPLKGTFTRTGNMSYARELHTATLLNDGRVLIAGGYIGRSSAELYIPQVMAPAPLLLSLSGDERGQGAILHANTSQVASLDNPAAVGEALEIFLTGLGDGSQIPPQVSIGGRMAEVLWFGNPPGYAGLSQINVRVPAGVAPGPAVPVRLTYIGRPSNEVTIGVR